MESFFKLVNSIASFRESIPAPEFVVPLALIVGITLAGFLLEKIVLKRFVKTLRPLLLLHYDFAG